MSFLKLNQMDYDISIKIFKKIIFTALLFLILVVSCKEVQKKDTETVKEEIAYASFGEKITAENVISKEKMADKFDNLKDGDTIQVKFASNINEVCKSKGCWMKLDLGSKKESMVRFKDYGFFVPLDADKKDVIVSGKAYVTRTSVDELKHYAKDAGKTNEEIAAIIEPKFTYAFEAEGVLMKK